MHWFVGTRREPPTWPKRVEHDEDLVPAALAGAARGGLGSKSHAAVTVFHDPGLSSAGERSLLAFTRWGHAVSWTGRGLPASLALALAPLTRGSADRAFGGEEWADASGRTVVFVCAHGTRDHRCGDCGPPILRALSAASAPPLLALACSHVGGHRFAGNMLVYPAGAWFALVTPENAVAAVASVVGGGDGGSTAFARGRVFSPSLKK